MTYHQQKSQTIWKEDQAVLLPHGLAMGDTFFFDDGVSRCSAASRCNPTVAILHFECIATHWHLSIKITGGRHVHSPCQVHVGHCPVDVTVGDDLEEAVVQIIVNPSESKTEFQKLKA